MPLVSTKGMKRTQRRASSASRQRIGGLRASLAPATSYEGAAGPARTAPPQRLRYPSSLRQRGGSAPGAAAPRGAASGSAPLPPPGPAGSAGAGSEPRRAGPRRLRSAPPAPRGGLRGRRNRRPLTPVNARPGWPQRPLPCPPAARLAPRHRLTSVPSPQALPCRARVRGRHPPLPAPGRRAVPSPQRRPLSASLRPRGSPPAPQPRRASWRGAAVSR